MSTTAATCFAPYAVATGEPLRLAMQRLWLAGRVTPAGARLTVQHVFRSEEEKPIEVIYAFALPRDAALRAFRITGEGFEVHSELKPTEDAVKTYEQGIAQGSLSTLARLYGDGTVNLTVGNVRPNETVTVYLEVAAGAELRDDGFRFRFPFTLAPSYHARMRAAVVAGEGEIELPHDQFGDVILPRYRQDASSLHEVGFELSVLHQLPIEEIASPSHSIRVKDGGSEGTRVTLAPARDVPDRDLVLDVRFKEIVPQVFAGPAAEAGRPFAAIVPSKAFGEQPSAPRRIVFLLDRSGSMGGPPIKQARQAIEACLAVLAPEDRFGLVAFDDQVEAMRDTLVSGIREDRREATDFLKRVDARGGTELAQGFQAAVRLLEGGGDVFVLTDGQVSGTEEILAKARTVGVRISCLGIGSASQDRFLTLLARETGGVSRFVTPRERVDLAAVDLFASIGQPVASELKTSDDIQPEVPRQVFAGTPVLLFGTAAKDSVELTWDGGRLTLPMPEGDVATGETVRLLQGSRLITDWESRYPAEEALAPLEKRKRSRVAARLVELSTTYGLASREMSLVAVVKRAGDRPGDLPETRIVPVGMPQDVSFGAYFGPTQVRYQASLMLPGSPPAASAPMPFAGPIRPGTPMASAGNRVMKALFRKRHQDESFEGILAAPPPSGPVDELMKLAAELEPDGGMPGRDASARAKKSAEAVLKFVKAGHSLTQGAFRSHVARLVGFLKSLKGLSEEDQALVDRAIEAAARLA